MDEALRYAPGYRALFARAIPAYMLNEIDPAIAAIAPEEMKPDNLTIFDVGANTGVFSAALLTHSGRFIKKIHLFEPMPGTSSGSMDTLREASMVLTLRSSKSIALPFPMRQVKSRCVPTRPSLDSPRQR